MKTGKPLVGSRAPVRMRKVKTAALGRICEWPKCDTRLTIYNRRETCYLHTPKRVPRIRGRDGARIKAMGLGVDTSVRCYSCAIRLGEWGNEAKEVQSPGTGEWHWWVPVVDKYVRLCEVQA
jgi:hypothetical protein